MSEKFKAMIFICNMKVSTNYLLYIVECTGWHKKNYFFKNNGKNDWLEDLNETPDW
jgi:hypothetical protein